MVRIWFPIGWNFTLHNLQVPFFPQYIAGGNWFLTMPPKNWAFFRKAIGLILLFPVLFGAVVTSGPSDHTIKSRKTKIVLPLIAV